MQNSFFRITLLSILLLTGCGPKAATGPSRSAPLHRQTNAPEFPFTDQEINPDLLEGTWKVTHMKGVHPFDTISTAGRGALTISLKDGEYTNVAELSRKMGSASERTVKVFEAGEVRFQQKHDLLMFTPYMPARGEADRKTDSFTEIFDAELAKSFNLTEGGKGYCGVKNWRAGRIQYADQTKSCVGSFPAFSFAHVKAVTDSSLSLAYCLRKGTSAAPSYDCHNVEYVK